MIFHKIALYLLHACLSPAGLFFKINVFKNIFQDYNQSVKQFGFCFDGPDLGPNCLQKLSADDASR